MDTISNIAKTLNVDSNMILFSFLIAACAIICIVVVIICMVFISVRKGNEKKKQKERYRNNAAREPRHEIVRHHNNQMPRFEQDRFEEELYEQSQPVRQERPSAKVVPQKRTGNEFRRESAPVPAPPAATPRPVQPQPVEPVPAPAPPVSTPPPAPAPTPEKAVSAPDKNIHSASPKASFADRIPKIVRPSAPDVTEAEDVHLSHVVDDIERHHKSDPSKKKKPDKPIKENKNKALSAKALKKRAKKIAIPKTVQETIPYVRVYPDTGIIETHDGHFTKSFLLDDVNYSVSKPEEQTNMFLKYAEFMNSFDVTTRFQITINQKNMNVSEFEAETMLPFQDDGLDHLRKERNDMIRAKIREGKNELVKEKYLTVSAEAETYDAALTVFGRLESEIAENIKKIGGAVVHPLSSSQRLEILHDIYNPDSVGFFGNNMSRNSKGELVFNKDKFSFDIMRRMGLTTKDMIGPESFTFKSDHGMIGDKFFRALFMRTIPTSVKDEFLKDLTDMDTNMVTSLIYQPIDTQTAIKMARQDIVNVNANMIDKQKKASKAGYSVELINPDLQDAAAEANALRDDLTHKNQKLFYLTLVIVHFADSKEELDSETKSIQSIARRHLIDVKKLSWQQENGLDSVLPLCHNKLQIKRSLTTEGSAVFMPFVNQELHDKNGGMYYGNNAVSNNLILHNRRNSKNGNGFIFGTPGSGKSMCAKQEMMTVLISSQDDVIVIDPEAEYYPMAEMLGGEVIRIAPGSGVHINPFDIDLNAESEEDPITVKADFIVTICENIVGDRYGLTPGQRSMIDRHVKRCYEPYLNSRDMVTGQYDSRLLPTLRDFYFQLREETGYDAKNLADALEIYVTGSQNLFAFPTNVEYTKRFVVYDISKIGNAMKSLGLLVVLDNIWNRIVAGRDAGKNVWFFIDEIYLLFKNESSAEFLRNLYKRARKYGGIPTGITQNVSDLLENPTARTMISNCEFIQMLNQAPLDRAQLGDLLNISTTQMDFITNASPGHGLIYDGTHIVPFINKLPKDTMQYEVMTTKLSEVNERDERRREEKLIREREAMAAVEPSSES